VKHWFKSQYIELAMKMIRSASKNSNSLSHAKKEFLAAGYIPLDQKQEDDPNKWIQQNVLDLLSVFSTQGHSGFSASYCINTFETLASFKPLIPITCKDSEWGDAIDGETFQNNRLSSVFKRGKDGHPYYLDAIVWRGQNGSTFTGSVEDSNGNTVTSRQNIRLPFRPKTFYVDVIETEWADKEETVEKKGGGWWTSIIKDESQLEEVFEYYIKS
jgi:hypothetical protein